MTTQSGCTSRISARRRALVLLAVGMCAACTAATPNQQRIDRGDAGTGDVVIGIAWPFSAHPDILLKEGLQLAVAEVNSSGGVHGRRLRLRLEDDHESVDSGRMVADRLAHDPEVVAVIGHLQSYVTLPAAPIYDEAGVILLTPTATASDLTNHAYRYVFRGTFDDHTIGQKMADYALDQGFRRVAIYYMRGTYGRDIANAFEERATQQGIAIVERQAYGESGNATARAFRATFDSWRTNEFDALFVAGEVPAAGILIAEARRAGLRVPVIGVDAMSSRGLMASAGDASEGTVVPAPFHPDEPREAVGRFVQNFRARFAVAPDAGSALGYDGVWVLTNAMRRAAVTTPDAISAALRSDASWEGATGRFSFDSTGALRDRPLLKLVVRKGEFEFLRDRLPSTRVALGKR